VVPPDSIEDVTEDKPHLTTILIGIDTIDHTILREEYEVFPLSDDRSGSLGIDAEEIH